MRYIYTYIGYIGGALYSGRFSIEYYIGYSFFLIFIINDITKILQAIYVLYFVYFPSFSSNNLFQKVVILHILAIFISLFI